MRVKPCFLNSGETSHLSVEHGWCMRLDNQQAVEAAPASREESHSICLSPFA